MGTGLRRRCPRRGVGWDVVTAGVLTRLRGGLVVSCQAPPDDPLSGPEIMARMAATVVIAGAVGVRAEGLDDLRAVRERVDVPLIGLWKDGTDPVYITPTLDHALAVAKTGAEVIALDGTRRPRPDGRSLAATIAELHRGTGALVMADVADVEDGVAAAAAGADLVGTTLSGYTAGSRGPDGPDLALVAALAARLPVPVLAEGRIGTPREAAAALAAGAWAVVVGTAVTRPQAMARRFVDGLPG